MKKFIAAFDGLKFSESAMQYAILLAKHHHAHLVGVFLEDITYHSYKIYELVKSDGISTKKLRQLEEKDLATRKKAVELFEKSCSNGKITFSVHHDKKIALAELVHETVFADLLIIDANETLTHYTEPVPSRFIKNLLHDIHCPVIVVPKKFKPIDKLIFMYDGTPASMNAIKTFGYVFPALTSTESEVLSIKTIHSDNHLRDNKLFKEWMKRHFPKCTYTILKGYTEDEISAVVNAGKPDVLFITGAYKRGTLSMWLRRSTADFLMAEIKTPVFIAHS